VRYTHFRKLVSQGDLAHEEVLPFPAHVRDNYPDVSEEVALAWVNACNRSAAQGVLATGSSYSRVVYWI
jgi:hypothetical protein